MTGGDGRPDPDAGPGWRWDVALSFASAQRSYVEQVAGALTARGGGVDVLPEDHQAGAALASSTTSWPAISAAGTRLHQVPDPAALATVASPALSGSATTAVVCLP
jgi:hypothetical protein